MVGCTQENAEYEEAEMVDSNMNYEDSQKSSEFEIYLKNENEGKIMEAGIYISAESGYETIYDFERSSTEHSIYGLEMNISDEFPLSHVLQCYVNGKTPLVTIYANSKSSISFIDSFRLAREFGSLNIPIYLNLVPYSSNDWPDFDVYKETWEEIAHVFESFAANTTIIWSIASSDSPLYESVVPETTLFDRTGLIYYGQIDNEGMDFLNSLDTLYSLTDKPIVISAFGISHYSTSTHQYRTDEAASIINNLYTVLASKYPKVSSIVYVDKDLTVNSPPKVICNNYRVTDEKGLLESYSQTVSEFVKKSSDKYIKTNFIGKILNDRYYIPKEMFEYYNLTISDMAEESFEYEGYIALDSIDSLSGKIEDEIVYLLEK